MSNDQRLYLRVFADLLNFYYNMNQVQFRLFRLSNKRLRHRVKQHFSVQPNEITWAFFCTKLKLNYVSCRYAYIHNFRRKYKVFNLCSFTFFSYSWNKTAGIITHNSEQHFVVITHTPRDHININWTNHYNHKYNESIQF